MLSFRAPLLHLHPDSHRLSDYPSKLLDALRSWFYDPGIMTGKIVQSRLHGEERTLPQFTIVRSNEDDFAKPEALVRKLPSADIAGRLGRRPAALAVKTQIGLRLKMKPPDSRRYPSNPDPGPSGFDWT